MTASPFSAADAAIAELRTDLEAVKAELAEMKARLSPASSNDRLLTITDVAEWTGIHEVTLRGYARLPETNAKHLPTVALGGRYKVIPNELREWLERNRLGQDGANL